MNRRAKAAWYLDRFMVYLELVAIGSTITFFALLILWVVLRPY